MALVLHRLSPCSLLLKFRKLSHPLDPFLILSTRLMVIAREKQEATKATTSRAKSQSHNERKEAIFKYNVIPTRSISQVSIPPPSKDAISFEETFTTTPPDTRGHQPSQRRSRKRVQTWSKPSAETPPSSLTSCVPMMQMQREKTHTKHAEKGAKRGYLKKEKGDST
uniref:Uncharacterized protein n=1 Tax=Coccidioides posadasii RMSCC 3488 TaxID=454284 RepID=A0A0J6FUI9_COCPO|nr:hypothetical protein CPAG_09359 [Coccidioides posadasii RMSCC 3488]